MVEKAHTAAGEDTGWWPNVYEPLKNVGRKIADFFAPEAEASATEDFYEINVELPGVSPDDVEVSLTEHILTVRGSKTFEREETGRTYFFSERRYGEFHRSFRLPPDVEDTDISAEFRNGVLTLRVPKRGTHPEKTRRIAVKSI